MATTDGTQYRSYLLRVWKESGHPAWRGSLRNLDTDETVAFADLEQLALYLLSAAPPSEEWMETRTAGMPTHPQADAPTRGECCG